MAFLVYALSYEPETALIGKSSQFAIFPVLQSPSKLKHPKFAIQLFEEKWKRGDSLWIPHNLAKNATLMKTNC